MITLEFTDGSTRSYSLVRADMNRVQFDAQVYKGSTAQRWLPAGTEDVQGVSTRLRFEVPRPDPAVTFNGNPVSYDGEPVTFTVLASGRVDELLADLRAAVLIETNYGAWRVAGVRTMVEQPAGLGYIVTLNVELLNPRYEDRTGALRLISESLWELR